MSADLQPAFHQPASWAVEAEQREIDDLDSELARHMGDLNDEGEEFLTGKELTLNQVSELQSSAAPVRKHKQTRTVSEVEWDNVENEEHWLVASPDDKPGAGALTVQDADDDDGRVLRIKPVKTKKVSKAASMDAKEVLAEVQPGAGAAVDVAAQASAGVVAAAAPASEWEGDLPATAAVATAEEAPREEEATQQLFEGQEEQQQHEEYGEGAEYRLPDQADRDEGKEVELNAFDQATHHAAAGPPSMHTAARADLKAMSAPPPPSAKPKRATPSRPRPPAAKQRKGSADRKGLTTTAAATPPRPAAPKPSRPAAAKPRPSPKPHLTSVNHQPRSNIKGPSFEQYTSRPDFLTYANVKQSTPHGILPTPPKRPAPTSQEELPSVVGSPSRPTMSTVRAGVTVTAPKTRTPSARSVEDMDAAAKQEAKVEAAEQEAKAAATEAHQQAAQESQRVVEAAKATLAMQPSQQQQQPAAPKAPGFLAKLKAKFKACAS